MKNEFSLDEEARNLSSEYRQYLINRHGTVELDPMPDMNDADPYNWPKWKVYFDPLSRHWPLIKTLKLY